MSKIETKEYNGHLIEIHIDEDGFASDPYEDWGCMPPAMMFYIGNRGITSKDHFRWSDIANLIDIKHCNTKAKRLKLFDIFADKFEDYEEMLRESKEYCGKDTAERFVNLCREQDKGNPSYWSEATDMFDDLENLCKIVGVPCLNKQSNGYSQGDSTLVFMAYTPEFVEKVGIEQKNCEAALLSDFKVYTAWCWGDVYGYVIKCIIDTDEDGDHILSDNLESCWGYYGDDHKESGLMEAAESMVDCLVERDKKEKAMAFEAACRDIETV